MSYHNATRTLLLIASFVGASCTTTSSVDIGDPEEVAMLPNGEVSIDSLRAAIADVEGQSASPPDDEPQTSEPKGPIDAYEDVSTDPPAGARSYPGLDEKEAVSVDSKAQRTRLDAPKARPEMGGAPKEPTTDRRISFAGNEGLPVSGLDPRLSNASLKIQDRDYTYAFIILNEYLSDEIEAELSRYGVALLGEHDSAHKARVPVDPRKLHDLEELSYIEWIGYSENEQKLDQPLKAAVKQFSDQTNVLPVVINFFEAEAVKRFEQLLRENDIVPGAYDSDLEAFSAVVPIDRIDWLTDKDFVLFIELERPSITGHDQSMAVMGVDYIRPGGSGARFSGASTILGIMDTGFMVGSAAPTMHQDLNKWGCGRNFTSDAAGVWNDQNGHGSHVIGTILGTGTADSRNRGAATGVGNSSSTRIRAAKIWTSAGTSPSSAWMRNAMDYLDNGSECSSGKPKVINLSGGSTGANQVGTDSRSRKLDAKVWKDKQSYVVCSGNSGAGAGTIWSPGVAKNALTVGNVLDNTFPTVGDIRASSSRGPTGDSRMKPNVVGSGTTVTSVNAGTTSGYNNQIGCSMATPHVSGIAATLLQHYPDFRDRPFLLRAHLMATAILHDDTTTPASNSAGGRNTYGLGRIESYIAHWARPNPNGWSTHWAWRTITNKNWGFRDVTVPSGTDRLVVVLTWDEPNASSGASSAVKYDVDLWIDRGANCTPDAKGQCGEWASQSWDDNVEYLIINNPPAGTYRLKMINWKAPKSGIPVAIAATIIRGDPTPNMGLALSASSTTPSVGSTVTITATVRNPSYVASGVHLQRMNLPAGLTDQGVSTTREDGVTIDFTVSDLSLGNIVQGDSRSARWTFRVNTAGPKTLRFRAWSENGGTVTQSITLNP